MNGYLLMARCLYEDCPLEIVRTFKAAQAAAEQWADDHKGLVRAVNEILGSDLASVYSLVCVNVRGGRVVPRSLTVLHPFMNADDNTSGATTTVAESVSAENAPRYCCDPQIETLTLHLAVPPPPTTDLNIHLVVDEHGDFGLGDTSENARDNYNDCFGEGKCTNEVRIELSVPLPQVLKANA